MSTDVCVPISKLAETILYAREQLDEVGLAGGIVGHVGDGNFHALLMLDQVMLWSKPKLTVSTNISCNMHCYAAAHAPVNTG